MTEIFIYIVLIFTLNYIFKKINFIPNYTGEKHQLFTSQKVTQLTGGIYVFLIIVYIFSFNLEFLIFSFLILLIGLLSDKNYLKSPKKRIFIQFLLVLSFVFFLDLSISSTRIELIDKLLNYKIFSYLFISFCILVLINGSNFIDGLNGLLIGYSLIVIYYIFNLGLLNELQISDNLIFFFIYSLGFLLLLNYMSLFFLGDGGSYLIGILLSFILISIYKLNQYSISPYYIILLLWYPCFENLFSILRKNNKKLSPIYPDNKHLHQLIFFYFKKKIKLNVNYLNSLVSIMINLFNFIVFYFASQSPSVTIKQILLLIFCISSYLILYLILNNSFNLSSKKNKL